MKYFDSGFYVFNMCTFNLKCTLYEYMDSFVCVSSVMPSLFIFSAFVRKWWRAILIAIGVFLYLLYLAIFIALAVIFAPQNGKSKDRNLNKGSHVSSLSLPAFHCLQYGKTTYSVLQATGEVESVNKRYIRDPII